MFLSTPNIGACVARGMGRYWSLMTIPEHLIFLDRKTMRYFLENKLDLTMTDWISTGKWANFGFLVYKLRKMFPALIHSAMVEKVKNSSLNDLSLYVPTGDIQYAAAKKS